MVVYTKGEQAPGRARTQVQASIQRLQEMVVEVQNGLQDRLESSITAQKQYVSGVLGEAKKLKDELKQDETALEEFAGRRDGELAGCWS